MCKLLSGAGPLADRIGPLRSWTSCSSVKFSVGLFTSLHKQALLSSFLSRACFGNSEVAKVKLYTAFKQTGLVRFILLAWCCNAEMLNPLKL